MLILHIEVGVLLESRLPSSEMEEDRVGKECLEEPDLHCPINGHVWR